LFWREVDDVRVFYTLPHPADTLDDERAGHVIRAGRLLDELRRAGEEVEVCEAARDHGSQASVSAYRRLVRGALPRRAAESVRDVGRLVHARRFAASAVASARTFRPDVVLETETVFGRAGTEISRRLDVPLVLDDVGPARESEEVYGVRLARLARRTRRHALDQARLVVAVSRTIEECLLAEGVPAHKIVYVPNGVDRRFVAHAGFDRERVLIRCAIPTDRVVFVYVGSFQAFHRVDLLVGAFALLDLLPVHLLLVGDGDGLEATRRDVRARGLDASVTFAGRVPHGDVAALVRASDVAVLPATADYTNPMKLFEYLAAGKPVVAPCQPAVTSIVEHARQGFLFAPGDVVSMAGAMRALAVDPSLRERLGVHAALVGRESGWDVRAAALTAAIDAALAERPSVAPGTPPRNRPGF
jgi:glycosyltransferase involved in cell wall biosynthesis